MDQRGCMAWAGYLLLWVALSILAAYAFWQAHVALLYWTALLIANPQLRPFGWNSMSLVGVSKLSIFFWGAGWLMFTVYMEQGLRNGVIERHLLRQSGRFALGLLLFWGVAWLLVLL